MKENFYQDHHHSKHEDFCAKQENCEVQAKQQVPLADEQTTLFATERARTRIIKVPVVLAERTIQIVVESDIPLNPPATEIKRVKKHVFLNQVKLVPVRFAPIPGTDFFRVTRAKLFVAGHIRKNIEYASRECNGALQDRIANVPFSGFAELTANEFLASPIIGISESTEANFLNEKTELDARLDKFFFQNLVKYNEQPFGELVAANFFELDFSPHGVNHHGTFNSVREKIVLDLTVKVLQVQQVTSTNEVVIVPGFPGAVPLPSPTSTATPINLLESKQKNNDC